MSASAIQGGHKKNHPQVCYWQSIICASCWHEC